MNKFEFIEELEKKLKFVPKEDREDALEYYRELLEDMEVSDSEDVTVKIGTPETVAKEVLENCTQKTIEEQENNKTVKKSSKVIRMTLLWLASLPVTLPVAIVILVLVLTVLITVAAVLGAIAVTSAVLVPVGIFIAILAFSAAGAQILICLGAGLTVTAMGALILAASLKLWQLFLRGVAAVCKSFVKKNSK